MKENVRGREKDYPAGEVAKKQITNSWTAWDAHVAHGDTYVLRREIAKRVLKITGTNLKCHAHIRLSKT